MPSLPETNGSLFVRTDFADDSAWGALVRAVSQENEDGFRAYVEFVNDPEFRDADQHSLKAGLQAIHSDAAVLFVADSPALIQPEFPILVVDILEDRQSFRCLARELWSVDNNLNIHNMDWEEFLDATDSYGVFRGFAQA